MRGPRAVAVSEHQEDFWLLQRLSQDPAAYLVVGELGVRGPLDAQHLQEALRTVVADSPMLRTSLHLAGGRLRALEWDDDASAPDVVLAPPDSSYNDLVALASAPIVLDKPCAIRLVLQSSSSTRHRLLLSSHHAFLDWNGLRAVFHDLLSELTGTARAQRSDYSCYIGAHLLKRSSSGGEDLAFWRQQLRAAFQSASPLAEPGERRQGTVQTARHTLDDDVVRSIRRLCADRAVTPFMVVTAALARLMARNQPRVVLGMPYDGRVDDMSAIGVYVSVLPLVIQLAPEQRLGDGALSVREGVFQALEHSAVSLADLLLLADGEAPWNVIVNGLSSVRGQRRQGQLLVTEMLPVTTGAKADLSLTVIEDGESLNIMATDTLNSSVAAVESFLSRLVAEIETSTQCSDRSRVQLEVMRELWDNVWDAPVEHNNALTGVAGNHFTAADIEAYVARVSGLCDSALPPTGGDVLEVGCGNGALVRAIAGRVDRYVATDPSPVAISAIESLEEDAAVEAAVCFAHEVSERVSGRFDVILMSGVVQFFPDLLYLRRVIAQLTAMLNPAGVLVIADVVRRSSSQFKNSLLLDPEFFECLRTGDGLPSVTILNREQDMSPLPSVLKERYDVLVGGGSAPNVTLAAISTGPHESTRAPLPQETIQGEPLAHLIASAAAVVLGVSVGVDDDIFDLGATSLTVASIVATVRRYPEPSLLRVKHFFSDSATPSSVAALAQRGAAKVQS